MAVNPLPFLQNMPDPGQAFLQSFQQARAQRDQQIAQQSRQAQYAQWIQRLQQDRSPETLSQFMLAFPEQADAITKAFAPMDEANKRTQLDFYGQALLALNRGDTNFTKQLVQQRLDAAKNTPGQEQQAKELEYGLTQIDQNPEALKAMLAVTVQRLDPEGYKTLYAAQSGELTGFQKDLIAAGVDPTSEEGRAKAKEFVSLKVDPIVQMPTPQGTPFVGRQSEYFRRYGGGAPPPNAKVPSPMTKAEYDALPPGTEYYDPRDNQLKRKSRKALSGVPAPKVDKNGMPATLTQAQYNAVVQAKGKAKTDEWMRRNNITVSGQ